MFIEALMVFKSYKPLKLEKGMLFLVQQPRFKEIVKLDKVPANEEEFIKINGYPVEPYIIDVVNPNLSQEEVIWATPEQIGWFDEGEHCDELCDIEVKHFNRILEGYDGYVHIEVEYDEEEDDEDMITPVLYNNKVTISYADIEDDDDEDDDDEEEEDSEDDGPTDPEEKYWRAVQAWTERRSDTNDDEW
jgi:hypothetical protein